MKAKMKIVVKTSKALAVFLLVGALLWPACAKEEEQKTGAPPIPVRFGKVTKGDITMTLAFVGNVAPDKQAILMSNVPGMVKKVYHRDGESVKKGERLIQIDPEEIDLGMKQAKAALSLSYATSAQARIQRNAMEKEFDRIKELMDRGAVSKSDYDKAEAGYKATKEAVRMAGAGVRNARAVISKAKLYKRDTVIKAPFAGEIAKLLVEEGELIKTMPPTPILALIDYDRVKIECPVAERDVGSVKVGMPVTVVMDAYPNVTIEATIDRVVPFLEPQSRTFTIKVLLDNPEHLYKPGMMARVYVNAVFHEIISVHRDAFSLNNFTADMRIVEVVEGVARERMAVPGRGLGDRIELRELGGLKIGSVVVTSGASDIQEGQPIKLSQGEGEPDARSAPAENPAREANEENDK